MLVTSVRFMKFLIIFSLLIIGHAGQAWCSNPVVERVFASRKVVSTLYFSENSYLLNEDNRTQLEGLVADLKAEISRGRFVRVEGFASREGRDVYSFKLSLQRARSVLDYFEELGTLPEIYLTGYGDMKAEGASPSNEWRVEIATYENLVDVRMVKKKLPTMLARPIEDTSPDNIQSLLDTKMGYSESLSKFDEPLIIDALTIEQALMEKLESLPSKPSGAVSHVE